MSPSLRLLAGILVGAALRGAPLPERPAAPAAAGKEAVDLQSLQTAIHAVYQRFDAQTQSFTHLDKELKALRADLEQKLQAQDIAPLRTSVGTVVLRIQSVQDAIDKLSAVVRARNGDTDTRIEAVNRALAGLRQQVTQLDANLTQLRKVEAARPVAAPPAAPPFPLATVVELAAACTLVLAVLILWAASRRRRNEPAPTDELAGVVGRLKEEWEQTLRTSTTEWGRTLSERDRRLTETLDEVRRLAAQGERSEPTPDPAEAPTVAKETETEPGSMRPAATAALWPAPFRDADSPLTRWRALLDSHLESPEHPALPVLAAVLALRITMERTGRTLTDVVDAVAAVGLAVHTYWHSLADLTEDDWQRASADWIDGLKRYVAPVAAALEIREIVPGARFDPDTMQTVEEGPGNHLNVASVHSWAILDRAGERPKVLHRARVATT